MIEALSIYKQSIHSKYSIYPQGPRFHYGGPEIYDEIGLVYNVYRHLNICLAS